MSNRFVTFNEYETAIINLKKLIKNALAGLGVGEHALLNNEEHPDTADEDVQGGDLIWGGSGYGNIRWQRLPKGEVGQILEMSDIIGFGTGPQWGKKITISSSPPSGGSNGDIWFQYTE